MDDKRKKMGDTAELLKGVDENVAEYSFTIDDILAEFGVERSVPEAVEEGDGSEPATPAEQKPADPDDELTQALRGTLEEMRTDLENAQLRAIEADVQAEAEDAQQDDYTVHVFETQNGGDEKAKGRLFRRKPQDDSAGSMKKIVTRETNDMSKVFGNEFEKYFGDEQTVDQKKKRKKRHKSEKELEKELFGGEAPVIPGSPDRTPVGELAEEDIPASEMADTLVRKLGRSHVRLAGAALLAALLAFMTFAPMLGLELPSVFAYRKAPYIFLFITALLQISVMLLCLETTVAGVRDLVTLRPNLESVVVFSCFASLAHIITILLFPTWGGYLSFAAVSSASLVVASYYGRRETIARLKSCKTAAAMSRPYLVCREPALYEGADGITKYRVKGPRYFVNQLEKTDLARKSWRVAAPIVIVASIVFAAVASYGRGAATAFPWSLAAISAAAAPFSLMLPFSLTFAKAARRLGMSGSAIAGWAAAEDFGEIGEIIITDNDIFPPGSVTLNGLKVYGGNAVDRVITYAASLVDASGAGIARPFLDLLSEQSGKVKRVTAFKFYENGGIGGEIEGCTVLAGTAAFMLRTGIKIPDDLGGKPLIFVAMNLELAGIFAVNYTASPAVNNGLKMLARHNITPIFAVRDFNITPSMIESRFKLSTDTVDFPKIEDRLALSDAERLYFAKPSAVISREGMGNYVETVVTARNLRRAAKICQALTLAGTILGMLTMFYLAFVGSPQTATPANMYLYMLLWMIPNWFAARWVNS